MNEFCHWINSQPHSYEMMHRKCRLAMSWSNVDNKPPAFPFKHLIQFACYHFVVSAYNKPLLLVSQEEVACKVQHIAKTIACGVSLFGDIIRFQAFYEVL